MKDAEIEIVEIHHDQKLDAPSGTALLLADSIKEVRPDSNLVIGRNGHAKREKNDIGISSIRIGNVVGVHEIIISSGLETLTLKHEAHDRSLFADGALVAAEYLSKVNQPGLYNMKDLVK
jgi:4-hydroxy-tetrahydrodipicolinate reductase